jgi:hypothetical protein
MKYLQRIGIGILVSGLLLFGACSSVGQSTEKIVTDSIATVLDSGSGQALAQDTILTDSTAVGENPGTEVPQVPPDTPSPLSWLLVILGPVLANLVKKITKTDATKAYLAVVILSVVSGIIATILSDVPFSWTNAVAWIGITYGFSQGFWSFWRNLIQPRKSRK